ncbi:MULTISPECIES: ABC transporter substrate-binding protein [unclassified Leptolyngbya]|uniref:ABC transporter substrate-binding protein n=1 Tax=unclassified Leptolyngbya TaxID=2650499 RepID=UPI0016888997|nr:MULTISPECIES: ABC transporter substrate-binding protein [unclassified Leptolyngbya]MBD1910016.1 ABC transporter substrate-binding protein [Leptolyngbya sp. FACHB-8]MBD2156838.1 ABC transporter substrate-binding protein [Leptolyngbya sp. FACHB-16]
MLNSLCACCGINRRDFLKLASLFSGSAVLSAAVGGCNSQPTASVGTTAGGQPNTSGGLDQPVKIGYLPILDASPLLIAHAQKLYEAEGLAAEQPVLFRSWAAIVEAFLARQVNVVHLLSPVTVWLRYGRQLPGKIVAWNHTDGSALTVQPEINQVEDLGGQTVAVPFWYSIHNVVLQQLLTQAGLTVVRKAENETIAPNEVNLVVLPPPEMVSALANKSIAGYIVAEPFNAAGETSKAGKVLRFTGDVWRNHACCVVFLHEDDITQRPQWTQGVVNAIVKSQHWMRDHRSEAAQILAKENGSYTPHPEAVLQKVLTGFDSAAYAKQGAIQHPEWAAQRIDFQPFPFPSYTEELVRLLQQTQVEGETAFLKQLNPTEVARDLVDDSFVKQALQQVGGPQAFGIPESLLREETFKAQRSLSFLG